METMTLRVRPTEVDKYVEVVSKFGWVLLNKIDMYDKGLDLGPYTPMNYKTKYKGKISLLNFERDPNMPNYKRYKDAENKYLSVTEDGTKRPKSSPLMIGLIWAVAGLIAFLVFGGLSILGSMGLRLLANWLGGMIVNGANGIIDTINGFIDMINGALGMINNLLEMIGQGGINFELHIDPIDGSSVGEFAKGVGRVSLMIMWGLDIINYIFLCVIPTLFLIPIGLLIFFVRLIKRLVANGRNRKVRAVRKEVLEQLEFLENRDKNQTTVNVSYSQTNNTTIVTGSQADAVAEAVAATVAEEVKETVEEAAAEPVKE